jgi:hypothetical protein
VWEAEAAMTLRDFAFLLIALGTGLLLVFITVLGMTFWIRDMVIMDVRWLAYTWAAIPWVLLVSGFSILYPRRRRV